jgi:hypothetical protein
VSKDKYDLKMTVCRIRAMPSAEHMQRKKAWDGHIKKPNNPNVGFLRFSKTRTISLIFGFRRLKRSLFIIANSYHAAAAP